MLRFGRSPNDLPLVLSSRSQNHALVDHNRARTDSDSPKDWNKLFEREY